MWLKVFFAFSQLEFVKTSREGGHGRSMVGSLLCRGNPMAGRIEIEVTLEAKGEHQVRHFNI